MLICISNLYLTKQKSDTVYGSNVFEFTFNGLFITKKDLELMFTN